MTRADLSDQWQRGADFQPRHWYGFLLRDRFWRYWFPPFFLAGCILLGESWEHGWIRCPEIHIALPHLNEPIWKVSEQ